MSSHAPGSTSAVPVSSEAEDDGERAALDGAGLDVVGEAFDGAGLVVVGRVLTEASGGVAHAASAAATSATPASADAVRTACRSMIAPAPPGARGRSA